MAAKASISPGYRWRLGIIALACLAFSAWFFYDGLVKYPRMQRKHAAYVRLQKQDLAHFSRRWEDYATAHGWSVDTPQPKSDASVVSQYVFAGLTLAVGLVFAGGFFWIGRRWIASDDQGLHTSWKARAPWEALTSIDKTRWESKGIAVVHYDRDGADRTITLDDWKYDRDPTAQMVGEIDQRLNPAAQEPAPGQEQPGSEKDNDAWDQASGGAGTGGEVEPPENPQLETRTQPRRER